MANYYVTISNNFEADSPEDAVREMIAYLSHADRLSYVVEDVETGGLASTYVDASEL